MDNLKCTEVNMDISQCILYSEAEIKMPFLQETAENVIHGLTGEDVDSLGLPHFNGLRQSQEVHIVGRVYCLSHAIDVVSHWNASPQLGIVLNIINTGYTYNMVCNGDDPLPHYIFAFAVPCLHQACIVKHLSDDLDLLFLVVWNSQPSIKCLH